MALFKFFSCDGTIKRKRFSYFGKYGELELYCFPDYLGKDYAALFVKENDEWVTSAWFDSRYLNGHQDKVPQTIEEWKARVHEIIAEMDRPPLEAIFFGFSQDYIDNKRKEFKLERERKEAEFQAKLKEKEDKRIQQEKEYLEKLKDKVRKDELIPGSYLIDLAYDLGIEVHPCTVGMIRKRVVEINSYKGRIRGKGQITSAYKLYKEIQLLLK